MSDVKINCAGTTELELDAAVLFYRTKVSSEIYATQHGARVVDGRPTLLPGVPLTLDSLAEFADLAARRTSYRGFVHERVVYLAPNTFAWWLPACTRRVWFKTEDALGERSGECRHPPLVFVVHKGARLVYALRRDERPHGGTHLFQAPYYNVWSDGDICEGNADFPEYTGADSIKPFEDAFFRSRFTHPNTDKLIHRRGGAVRLWLDLLDGADFPLHQLIDTKRTLADVISKFQTED
jgi:PRTRC genetic system protein B